MCINQKSNNDKLEDDDLFAFFSEDDIILEYVYTLKRDKGDFDPSWILKETAFIKSELLNYREEAISRQSAIIGNEILEGDITEREAFIAKFDVHFDVKWLSNGIDNPNLFQYDESEVFIDFETFSFFFFVFIFYLISVEFGFFFLAGCVFGKVYMILEEDDLDQHLVDTVADDYYKKVFALLDKNLRNNFVEKEILHTKLIGKKIEFEPSGELYFSFYYHHFFNLDYIIFSDKSLSFFESFFSWDDYNYVVHIYYSTFISVLIKYSIKINKKSKYLYNHNIRLYKLDFLYDHLDYIDPSISYKFTNYEYYLFYKDIKNLSSHQSSLWYNKHIMPIFNFNSIYKL